jgi:hypothetical protein
MFCQVRVLEILETLVKHTNRLKQYTCAPSTRFVQCASVAEAQRNVHGECPVAAQVYIFIAIMHTRDMQVQHTICRQYTCIPYYPQPHQCKHSIID